MIVCCGEALIDMVPRRVPAGTVLGNPATEGDLTAERDLDVMMPVAGGAVFNTAVALGRLGERTGFVAGLASDPFGQLLVTTLEAAGVDTSLSIRQDRPCTLAFVSFEGGHARYRFYDENTAGRMIEPSMMPSLEGAVAAHFGAISLISEPCGSAYEALAQRVKAHAVVSLDPNVRPGFVRDEAAYRARLGRMLALADIIKVSDEDLDWMLPGTAFEDAARVWLESGARIVTLTRGSRGAIALTPDFAVELAAPRVEVVDTVGAGDTFNAGMLAGLARAGRLGREQLGGLREEELRSALALAVQVAAITVSRAGANPPWQAELTG